MEFGITLTPKMHFLLHYPEIIREMGPVVYMSMMRFESKHKSLKNISKTANNFKNITQTISNRNEAQFVYNGFTYKNEFEFGKSTKASLTDFDDNDKIILAPIFNQNETQNEIQWFKMNSITYRRGFAIVIDGSIYSIERILISGENRYLLCYRLNCLTFCSYTHSFLVKKCEETDRKMIELEQLQCKRTYEVKFINGNYHIFASTLDICKTEQIS